MNTPEDFVNRLQAWIDNRGLNQSSAADILGVTRPYLNQILKGRREPGSNLVKTFQSLQEVPDVHYGEQRIQSSEQIEPLMPQEDVIAATKLRGEARALREIATRLEEEAAYLEQRAGFRKT